MKTLLDRMERLTRPLLLILCLFTVTFFIYRDFNIRMIFGFGALCALLGCNGLSCILSKRSLHLTPLKVSVLVLVATVLLNFLRPDSRHDADSVSFVIAMVIYTAFVLLARPDEKEGKRALQVCFLGGAFMAAFVLFFVAFDDLFWTTLFPFLSPTAQDYLKLYVPKGYSITLGGCTYTNYILYLGSTAACAYAAARKFDWKSAVALLCAGVFLAALLLVGRRGELLGAGICMILLLLALCTRKQRNILLFGGLAFGIAAFAAVVALLPWLRQFQPLVRYVMTVEQLLAGQDITSGRLELYTIALNAFAEHPLFGIGWDQFHTLIPAQFLALHGKDVEDVHCIYLQFLTEAGMVGAPFLLAPLVYGYCLICRQFRRLKQREDLQTAKMLCIASFLIQSFLLCLGIYDPNFQRVVFWCFYSIAILLQVAALDLEGYRPTDPMSRGLEQAIEWLKVRFLGIKDIHLSPVPLAAVLAVFTVTFFFYRDFGHRMIFGYALLGLVLMVHLLGRFRRREPIRLTPTVLAALALAGVIVLHFLLPGARRDADTASYIISMVICMAYLVFSPTGRDQGRWAERAMYWGAMGMAAFVVVFTLLPELFLTTVYPLLSDIAQRYYDFFQPQGYGVSLGTYSYTDYVLFLGIAVCCGELVNRKRVVENCLSILALLFAMVVLGRRGELLAAGIAVGVLVLLLCSPRNRRRVFLFGGALGLGTVVLVLLFLPQLKAVPVLARYVETIEQLLSGEDITSGRGALMAVAVQGFRSAPIFGVGWGRYVDLSAQIGMCDTDGNLIEDCHNIYLQFACETGLVGAVLICLPIFFLLYRTCRVLVRAKNVRAETALGFASVSFLVQCFLLFLGLYDPSFQKIIFWGFYALALLFLRFAEEVAQ